MLQKVQRIHACEDVARKTRQPSAVRFSLDPGSALELPNTGQIEVDHGVERQVERVAELSANGQVLEDGIHRLGVGHDRRRFEVFHELAYAEGSPRMAEVFLHAIEDINGRLGVVGAVRVPGEETRKVLDGTECLVAADWIMSAQLYYLLLMFERQPYSSWPRIG